LVQVAQAVQEHQATKAATTAHLVALQASQQAVVVAVHSKTQTVKMAVVVVVVVTVFRLAVWVFHCKDLTAVTAQAEHRLAVLVAVVQAR